MFYCFNEAENNNIDSVQSRSQYLRPGQFSIDDSGVIGTFKLSYLMYQSTRMCLLSSVLCWSQTKWRS